MILRYENQSFKPRKANRVTVNSILTRDCKEARNEWFPRAIPCKEEMLCSRGSIKF